MIKNDALHEILDLSHRWDFLTGELFEDRFDCEFFKLLAAHTFSFLFPYHTGDTLPRELLCVLFSIKEFACCPVGVSDESDVAQMVAHSFCQQSADGWIVIDGEYSEDQFAVYHNSGDIFVVDANTFDLTELL